MLARRDQENLVHAQQTAAAAKPLNQGIRGLAPKTPGNNNGRRGDRNDENAMTVRFKKDDKSADAFVTPGPARDRIALGAKTTNAKARAFATPGALTGGQGLTKARRRSGSSKKPKLKVHHQVETAPFDAGGVGASDEEPEIEYCPPPIKELDDGPDDFEFGPNKKFPQFQGDNYSRGWANLYKNIVGPDGLTRDERQSKELEDKIERHLELMMQQDAEKSLAKINRDVASLELYEEQKRRGSARPASAQSRPASSAASRSVSSAASSRKPLFANTRPPSSRQRDAARALSGLPQPRFAQPTASTRAKDALSDKGMPPSPAAKTTIGYARGRQVSSEIKEAKARDNSVSNTLRDFGDSSFVREQVILDELLQSNDILDDGEDIWEEDDNKDWFQQQLKAEKDVYLKTVD